MGTVASDSRAGVAASAGAAASRVRFDWAATLLSLWMAGGLYLDGWAHTHGRVDQSVLTPWHGVLYSGFLALAALYTLTFARRRPEGRGIRDAMPEGYGLSLAGVALFGVGAVGDTLWHILLGIEIGVDALYSPTHLLLAIGGTLMVSGPIRSAWRRAGAPGDWAEGAPLVIGLTTVLLVFTFFTVVMHPITERTAAGYAPSDPMVASLSQALGVAGILVAAITMTGLMLVAVRRRTLPFGSFTFIFGVNAWAMRFLTEGSPVSLILAAALAGLVADLVLRRSRGSAENRSSLAVLAFVVPTAYFYFYFIALLAGPGIWWTIHLWMGAPILAGIAGWLTNYAMSSGASEPAAVAR